MPPKKLKPLGQIEDSPSKPKQKGKSLTNTQYEDIFNAVINKQSSQHFHDFKSPIVGKSPELDAFSPKECASLENSQNTNSQKQKDEEPKKQEKTKRITHPRNTELIVSLNKPKQYHSESSNNQSESVSTVYSEEFRKNAVFSTPVIKEMTKTKKKPKSFREAVQCLKDTESQLSETLLGGLSQAQTSLNNSLLVDVPLSQPPEHLNHRERLLWLQSRRGDKVFVQCDTCDKWRLSDVQDPVDLPDKWYCHMNADRNYNNCSIPEQKLSIYVEADLITNQYTAGSLVWAKIISYPWWPAMVDDDPDTEQFYWIDDYDINIPKFYNVTFFDRQNENVTRAWIATSNLKSFKHNLNVDKKNVPPKYKARMRYAKEQALAAMNLPIKERLIQYSFISKTKKRINTPVGTPVHCSDSDNENNNSRNSKNIDKRRRTVDDPAAQLKKRLLQESKNDAETAKKADITKKVTRRRKTIGHANELLQSVKEPKKDNKVVDLDETIKNKVYKQDPKSRKSIADRDSSQDSKVSEEMTRRRGTHADSSFSKDSSQAKKITKRRSTISVHEFQKTAVEQEKEKKSTRNSREDSVQDMKESKKITRRRNTRGTSSIERDSSFSQDSNKERKITKRRSTICVHGSQESQKSVNMNETKRITRRRNTRGDTSIERYSNFSQDSDKEKKIAKRKTTIAENVKDYLKTEKIEDGNQDIPGRDSSQNSNLPENDRLKNNRLDRSLDRESSFSEGSKRSGRITRRRMTIGKYDSQNSEDSQKTIKEESSNRRSSIHISDSSQNSNASAKIVKRRNTPDGLQKENKENTIKRRRNTIRESSSQRTSSQNSNDSQKITKRRSTIANSSLEGDLENKAIKERNMQQIVNNSQNENKRRRNSIREKDSQRDSSQNSDESQKNTKRKNTLLDSNAVKENTSSQGSQKEKKISKRRTTIHTLNVEEPQNTNIRNSQENKISRRRNTVEKDTSLTNLSVSSDNSTKLNKRRNTFICPTANSFTEETRFNESQSEPKKYRKTLGARKIVSTSKPKTIAKETESGYESAISTKRDEINKKNLSIILEESYNSPKQQSDEKMAKYHIPKKRRQTTDGQEKKIDDKKKSKDDDEELEITFTSLSQKLEQLDEEKRKKKFMAICKEIVNNDKDPTDPTISEEEKIFYEKLNSSLEQVKEKQGYLSDDSITKRVKDFESKLDKLLESKSDNNNSKP